MQRSEIDRAIDRLQREHYPEMDNRVRQYLEYHTQLLPVLGELPNQVGHYFGRRADVFLTRAGCLKRGCGLLVRIKTPLSQEDAWERLDRLDHGWWLSQADWVRDQIRVEVQ